MATERYHPLFAVDLAAACRYYDSIANTLGNRFRINVRSIIHNIVERPSSFGRIGGEFRGALVDRFPYVVVFTVDGAVPSILGLRHAASDRRDWFSRTMPAAGGEPADAPESASQGVSKMEDQPRRPGDR